MLRAKYQYTHQLRNCNQYYKTKLKLWLSDTAPLPVITTGLNDTLIVYSALLHSWHTCVLQQAMRPPGYTYSGAMPGQPRPHMGMGQGNMGMPQGAMSPAMSGVGNMQTPQVCIRTSLFACKLRRFSQHTADCCMYCLPSCAVFEHCA